jgi:hypothetical protein
MGELIWPYAQVAGLAGLLLALITRVGLLALAYYALKRKRPFRGRVGRFMVDTNPDSADAGASPSQTKHAG